MERVQFILQIALVILSPIVLTLSLVNGHYWAAGAYTFITAVNVYLFWFYAKRALAPKVSQAN